MSLHENFIGSNGMQNCHSCSMKKWQCHIHTHLKIIFHINKILVLWHGAHGCWMQWIHGVQIGKELWWGMGFLIFTIVSKLLGTKIHLSGEEWSKIGSSHYKKISTSCQRSLHYDSISSNDMQNQLLIYDLWRFEVR